MNLVTKGVLADDGGIIARAMDFAVNENFSTQASRYFSVMPANAGIQFLDSSWSSPRPKRGRNDSAMKWSFGQAAENSDLSN
ncbi:MAG: hypothetical protein M1469_10390 [Bacteroidetes bacterium]|nr:hypothetical protein [Bacteroidota bacterium]